MNSIKNKRSRQGGFLKLILFIIVVLFLLSYFNVTISGALNWFGTMFQNVFQ